MSFQVGGNLIFAVAQAGVLMLLARLGGPEEVGIFSYGLALVAPIMLFANMGLRNLVSTDSTHAFAPGMYHALRQWGVVGGVAITLVVSMAMSMTKGDDGLAMADDWLVLAVVLAILLSKIAEAQSELLYGMLQRAEKNKAIAMSLALRGGLGMGALGGTYWLTGEVFWAAMAYAGAWLVMAYGYDAHHTRKHAGLLVDKQTNFGWAELRPLLTLGLPMGLTALVINLNSSLPRLVLGQGVDMAALGYFASMVYVVTLGGIVVNGIGQTLAPRLASHFAAGNVGGFVRLASKGVALAAGLGVLGLGLAYLIGAEVLVLLFGPDYAGMGPMFVLLCGAAPFMFVGTLCGHVLTATRAIHLLSATYVVLAVVAVVASVGLISDLGLGLGLYGAVLTLYVLAITRNVADAAMLGLTLYQRAKKG